MLSGHLLIPMIVVRKTNNWLRLFDVRGSKVNIARPIKAPVRVAKPKRGIERQRYQGVGMIFYPFLQSLDSIGRPDV